YTLTLWSSRQDRADDPGAYSRRLQSLSITGLLAFGLTATFAMIDWLMSLEPNWSSTVYAAMVVMGGLLAALALMLAVLMLFADAEPSSGLLAPQAFNDLGNLLLSALLMWAYLAFSQYLVIWSGNLSEEIQWYLRRLANGWDWIALAIVLLGFIVPFLLL